MVFTLVVRLSTNVGKKILDRFLVTTCKNDKRGGLSGMTDEQ